MKKKNLCFTAILSSLLILVTLGGCNSVKPSKIQLIHQSFTKDYGAYAAWVFDGTAKGFSATDPEQELKVNEHSITFTQKTKGDSLQSPGGLSIPANVVQTVELRLKTSDSAALIMRWRQPNMGYTGENTAQIKLEKDGEWHDYQIQLSNVNGWQQTVVQFCFEISENTSIEIQSVRLSGIYFMTFPWVNFQFDHDVALLNEMKNSFATDDNSVSVGFSYVLEYFKKDNDGNYGCQSDIEYALKLSKTTGMPVMFWLRADPWGYLPDELYEDDANLMWTELLTNSPAYHNTETGYRNMCLAQTDLSGEKTLYWTLTEKALGQCSANIQKAIGENPGQILGITTTSEYRFCTQDDMYYLDYNPKTIAEFSRYCQKLYSRIEDFNSATSTEFDTYDLRSIDQNPATVEHKNGFDAPRNSRSSPTFWELWKNFRAQQIKLAVANLVNIIGEHLDSKFIYTHQIAYDDDLTASPISCGDVEGSNIGIDFFNYEANDVNLSAIRKLIGSDVTRSWGCPEWMITSSQDYTRTYEAFDRMVKAGIKYLGPFNYGSNNDYNIKGTESERAIIDYLIKIEYESNCLVKSKVSASGKINNADNLIDSSKNTICSGTGVQVGDKITFKLEEKRKISSLTFVPASNRDLYVGKIRIYASNRLIGECEIPTGNEEVTACFDEVETNSITVELIDPPKNSKNETEFATALIKAGHYADEGTPITDSIKLQEAQADEEEINFEWSAVGAEDTVYHLEISTSENFRSSDSLLTTGTSLTAGFTKKGKTYYYRVWAVNSSSCIVSDTLSFQT